jgi:hypothetical protein
MKNIFQSLFGGQKDKKTEKLGQDFGVRLSLEVTAAYHSLIKSELEQKNGIFLRRYGDGTVDLSAAGFYYLRHNLPSSIHEMVNQEQTEILIAARDAAEAIWLPSDRPIITGILQLTFRILGEEASRRTGQPFDTFANFMEPANFDLPNATSREFYIISLAQRLHEAKTVEEFKAADEETQVRISGADSLVCSAAWNALKKEPGLSSTELLDRVRGWMKDLNTIPDI